VPPSTDSATTDRGPPVCRSRRRRSAGEGSGAAPALTNVQTSTSQGAHSGAPPSRSPSGRSVASACAASQRNMTSVTAWACASARHGAGSAPFQSRSVRSSSQPGSVRIASSARPATCAGAHASPGVGFSAHQRGGSVFVPESTCSSAPTARSTVTKAICAAMPASRATAARTSSSRLASSNTTGTGSKTPAVVCRLAMA
jgi:hypothetical protein